MKSTLLLLIGACLLGGCSSLLLTEQQNSPVSSVDSSVNFHNKLQENFLNKQQTMVQREKTLTDLNNGKNIHYYVRGLMQDLVGNLQYVNNTTPVAITSFVMLDSDYMQMNLLGNQIAESLLHEVHKFGIPVIDFKTTDYIRVTEQGDFIFSKDFTELSRRSPVRYVVGGTMLKYNGGYLVNARIVGVESKAVVASAQSFIPGNVADAVLGSSAYGVTPVSAEPVADTARASIIQG